MPRFSPQGCGDGLLCLSTYEKYCHNGGLAFGHQSSVPPAQPRDPQLGAIIEVMAPMAAP
jgi:hypothetical protein